MSVLKYMASNGLVANPKKTSMLILNCKPADMPQSVKIGEDMVNRETSATLLGIKFQDNLQWAKQIHGKGGLIASLSSRLYIIKRMMSHVSKKPVLKLVNGLFMSKIRYGLQLYGKMRLVEEDPTGGDLKAIQIVQNDLIRVLNGTKVKDKVSII